MTHERWTERLSEYLDGELSPAERSDMDGHLAECAACRALLSELGAVVARARAVEDRPPREELWSGIAERIGAAPVLQRTATVRPIRPARRFVVSLPQLAAAAMVLLVLGGAGGWLAAPLLTGPAAAPLAPAAPAAVITASDPGTPDQAVASAVEELEAALAAGRERLSPSTVRTLETNLAIIDTAIAEAQRAVRSDPGNAYLQTHLADVMRRKVMLLQRAAALAAAQT